jgi:hypothetical protein
MPAERMLADPAIFAATTALRKADADLSDIQHQAGYSDIALTKRYAPTITTKLVKTVLKLRAQQEW